jgi:hypothetical protein
MLEDPKNKFPLKLGLGRKSVSDFQAGADREIGVASIPPQLNAPALIATLTNFHAAQPALECHQEDVEEYIERAIELLNAELRFPDHAAIYSPQVPSRPHKLAPWQMRKAMEFIERNLRDRIRAAGLASVSHLSSRNV